MLHASRSPESTANDRITAPWTRTLRRLVHCSAAVVVAATSAIAPRAIAGSLALEPIGRYGVGAGSAAAEIVAYDPATRRAFVTNGRHTRVDVVDLADPYSPSLVTSVDVTPWGSGPTSVATAAGVVAVAVPAVPEHDPGQVVLLDTDGSYLGEVTVGALPDMLTFTPDGSRILVANEGQPNDAYTVDPEGSVSIVDLSGGVPSASVTTIGFTDFNAGGPREGELPADVRVFGPGATVAEDLEPEYIAVSADGATAWVTLQENNAVAVIDVALATVIRIDALGFKDHSLAANPLDASDRDGGITITTWPVRGMYQPDAVAVLTSGGATYVLTANEGDARDYGGFSEEERVDDLLLDPVVFPDAASLQQDANLGRLRITTTLGDDGADGDYEVLYCYGARSFSVWSGDDGSLLFDSADDLEQITATRVPAIFNSEGTPATFDDRSDNKGPEPEAITVGRVGGVDYAFIGLERIGGVMAYDVATPSAPVFRAYEPSATADRAPEGVAFVPATDSPLDEPLLLVTNEESGTLAVLRIHADGLFAGGFEGADTSRWSEAVVP